MGKADGRQRRQQQFANAPVAVIAPAAVACANFPRGIAVHPVVVLAKCVGVAWVASRDALVGGDAAGRQSFVVANYGGVDFRKNRCDAKSGARGLDAEFIPRVAGFGGRAQRFPPLAFAVVAQPFARKPSVRRTGDECDRRAVKRRPAAFQPGNRHRSAASVVRRMSVINRPRQRRIFGDHPQVVPVRRQRAGIRVRAGVDQFAVQPPSADAKILPFGGKHQRHSVGEDLSVFHRAAAVRVASPGRNRRQNGHRPRFGECHRGENSRAHCHFANGFFRADGRRASRRVPAPFGRVPSFGRKGGESHRRPRRQSVPV